MNRLAFKYVIRSLLISAVFVIMFGQSAVSASDAGRTACDFLRIGTGARAAGMGGAYTAVSSGASASFWNPSGLADIDGGEIALGHFAWYQDTRLEHGTIAFNLGHRAGLAISATYLGYGKIAGYSSSGQATGNISANDYSGAMSLGYSVSDFLSVGITGKFIGQRLDDVSASTYALDFGVRLIKDRWAIGMVVANVGPDIIFEAEKGNLPTTTRIGLSGFPVDQLLVSVEFERGRFGELVWHNGIDYCLLEQYHLRMGHRHRPSEPDDDLASGLTFGAGVDLSGYSFDYAFTREASASNENLHRFSLTIRFGQ